MQEEELRHAEKAVEKIRERAELAPEVAMALKQSLRPSGRSTGDCRYWKAKDASIQRPRWPYQIVVDSNGLERPLWPPRPVN
jgi:hypothetical protein